MTENRNSRIPLRLWPGVVIVAVQWIIRFVVPVIAPDALQVSVFGGILGGLVLAIWWLFFSRADWLERLGALGLVIVVLYLTSMLVDESIATAMMGMMLIVYAIPVLCLAFVTWAIVSRNWPDSVRRATLCATVVLACGVWTLVRTGGFSSEMRNDFAWRWSETREERLLAGTSDELASNPLVETRMNGRFEWVGFRGANRDGIIRNVQIETDWSQSPPVEMWRRQVGPGWSSFAVRGDVFFTQEQRGEEEVVTCYKLSSGEPLWRHADTARFWESNAGAGPRATPTLSGERLYTFGATGILNALNVRDGSLVWSRKAATDTGVAIPGWAFAASPLVFGDIVVVATAGKLAAYDSSNGEPRWFGPDGGDGYSSPHLLTIDGVEQVVLLSKTGVVSVTPSKGQLLWDYPWPGGSRIVQPALTEEGDLLISRGEKSGLGRIRAKRGLDGWSVEEGWRSNRMKPYFSDFVVHKGHAFGFDGSNLVCIATTDGERKSKGGRYGSGQLVLLADQDLLLVLSEQGELALVAADPEALTERARIPAIEGKTWNHPALAGNVLLIRNDHEMAAFRLSLQDS